MSFSQAVISDEIMRAINYATRKGVVCVASVGNDGQTALVYPAAFGNVIGVASTNQQEQRSSFSNYGPDLVSLAAPGEALVTTYPGAHYAQVWGTSFSSALVAGGADLVLAAASNKSAAQIQPGDVKRALGQASTCDATGALGAGCMDLNAATEYVEWMRLPQTQTAH
jgi:thermitase